MTGYHIVDRRQFGRTPFTVEAIIESDIEVAVGMVENISVKGLYMRLLTGDPIPLQKRVRIDLYLPGSSDYLRILRLRARIIRVDENGMAVQFGPMPLETAAKLQTIITFMNEGQNIDASDYAKYAEG
ncbi:MAG TPA: hypothetical protein DCR97_04925 [Deltaproteobacteria bacterium]|nr:hypothetical protein [Deltaproteobacteria bacterium]